MKTKENEYRTKFKECNDAEIWIIPFGLNKWLKIATWLVQKHMEWGRHINSMNAIKLVNIVCHRRPGKQIYTGRSRKKGGESMEWTDRTPIIQEEEKKGENDDNEDEQMGNRS